MKYGMEDPFELGQRRMLGFWWADWRRWVAGHWRMFAKRVDRWLTP